MNSESVPLGYGIDFGTSKSAISVAYEDRVEVLKLGNTSSSSLTLPSFVYLHSAGHRASGDEGVSSALAEADIEPKDVDRLRAQQLWGAA
jgi:molecular chaperone DnaK (HSP70)